MNFFPLPILDNPDKPSLLFSFRFLLALIVCTVYATQYSQNIGLSVAVVCMVNHTAVDLFKQNQASPNVKNQQCGPIQNVTLDDSSSNVIDRVSNFIYAK